jgi:hypothetical protein
MATEVGATGVPEPISATPLQPLTPTLKKVPAAVVPAPVPVSAALSTVGSATVAVPELAPPLMLSVQVLAVTAPVKVIVPSEAWPVSGSTIAVTIPAANIARLIRIFMHPPKI